MPFARGRTRHVHGQLNGWEKDYAEQVLAVRLAAGSIVAYDFEPERLKLATVAGVDPWYTPDFRVMLPDGLIEFHEVKGHWEAAALLRIKMAADKHPYRFIAVTKRKKKDGGGWSSCDFSAEEAGR